MDEPEPSPAVYLGATIALLIVVLVILYGFEGHLWINAQFCGASPTMECVSRTERITLFTTLTLGGMLIGVLLRHQMRREARRDAERDQEVQAEMDKIRRERR